MIVMTRAKGKQPPKQDKGQTRVKVCSRTANAQGGLPNFPKHGEDTSASWFNFVASPRGNEEGLNGNK